ncbi:MAG: Flp pilus assembly complex ATPase component TadA [Methanomethylovorans sp.]|jgi:ATPase|nr:Flp pilus assembly complex ATPase component TadA [Methanomethylovorans sp.]
MKREGQRITRIASDTSAIIDGAISTRVKSGEYAGFQIIIPEAVVAELEAQANRGLEIGMKGLDELQELRKLANQAMIDLVFTGRRPNLDEVKLAGGGEIDALIRETAQQNNALLVTADRVQSQVAMAKGIDVDFITPRFIEHKPLKIEQFFTEDTMSVHLKNGVPPMAKRGSVSDVKFIRIREEPCTYGELKLISRELIERARSDPASFMELDFNGASVLQIGNMRVAVANPPFSDEIEITAVRPIAKVSLDQYRLSSVLKERIKEQRGILIAGPPGAGKSTFAAGIAIYLHEMGYVVKTMEAPRDLQVPKEITQYAPLDGSMEKTADLLLLVRPDYTIYDEVRKTSDFHIFADMRLAGVGMIGVVHANRAVDAIQRLIGRVELGIIPQVVDTVIFINKGEISNVQILEFTVKVPSGMTEADLARPVIIVTDIETGKTEYEIYSYGDQVVVMPVGLEVKNPSWKLAEGEVKEVIEHYATGPVDVKMLSDHKALVRVLEHDLPKVIGKGGKVIDNIEDILGIHIDVRKFESEEKKEKPQNKEFRPIIEKTKKHVILNIPELAAKDVEVYAGNEFLFSATVGRHGDIKVRGDSTIAVSILSAVEAGDPVTVKPL